MFYLIDQFDEQNVARRQSFWILVPWFLAGVLHEWDCRVLHSSNIQWALSNLFHNFFFVKMLMVIKKERRQIFTSAMKKTKQKKNLFTMQPVVTWFHQPCWLNFLSVKRGRALKLRRVKLMTITSFYFQRPCLEGSHLPSKTISALDDVISNNRFLKSSHDDKCYIVL